MKKFLYIIGILLLIVLVCIPFIINKKYSGYKEISYSEFKEKVEKNETFVLIVGRTGCSGCNSLKEILNKDYSLKYAKDLTLYYIDTHKDHMSEDDYIEFNSIIHYDYTPTAIIMENGKFDNNNIILQGSDEYDSMIRTLKKKGLLKG